MDDCKGLNVEVNGRGDVLIVLHLSDQLAPAVIGFDPAEAEALGKRLRDAAREALYMRKAVANG